MSGPLYLTEKTAPCDLKPVRLDRLSFVRLGTRFNSQKLLVVSDVLRFSGARFEFAWALIPNALMVNAIVNSIRRLINMRKGSSLI